MKIGKIIIVDLLCIVAFFLGLKFLGGSTYWEALFATIFTTVFMYLLLYKVFKLKHKSTDSTKANNN